jgi:hypothetical protein
MLERLHVKYPLFLSEFYKTLVFSINFRKKFKDQASSKSIQWESSCSTRTDRWMHMTKLIVTFRNFANVPKYGEYSLFSNVSVIVIYAGQKTRKAKTATARGWKLEIWKFISNLTKDTLHSTQLEHCKEERPNTYSTCTRSLTTCHL